MRNWIFGLAIAVGVYVLLRSDVAKAGGLLGDAIEGELVDEMSPYHGTGAIGTIAAGVDTASGNVLSRFGSWLGQRAADLRDYATGEGDPNR